MTENTPEMDSVADRARLTSGADTWHTEEAAGTLPRLMLSDGPHGIRQQREGGDALGIGDSVPATCFPPAVALGSTWNCELVQRVGAALGEEARAQGVHVLLGPGMNIKRSPLGGRNFEYISEDPHVTGEIASAMVDGIQSQGVAATPKHFAVNNQESDRMRVSADLDEQTLREIYLNAFETVVRDARPWALMSAYNRINGDFASAADWLLTGVLRREWGFDGIVMSDWGAVADRVASLHAGLDLEMPPSGTDDQIADAVRDGALEESFLDATVERLRLLAERVALERTQGYDADAHHAIAREAATESIVLLRNDGILPLDADRLERIAVIGEFAAVPRFQGGGSSRVVPTRLTPALDAIRATIADRAEVTYAPGFGAEGEDSLIAAAVETVRVADVALVFLGLPDHAESEGFDRTDLDLPFAQLRLLQAVTETGVPTVVVLSNGGVVSVSDWHQSVAALVEGWLLGQAGGEAMADVLFGTGAPSGRLTETIPLQLSDTPSYRTFPGGAGHVRYGEGLFVGYRHYDSADVEVAYPFGHGLTYTSFAYEDLEVARVEGGGCRVSFTVRNTGERAGSEVAQVYVGRDDARKDRPIHELRAFVKVHLKPGESARVERVLPSRAFAEWDLSHDRWNVTGGARLIEVGGSSRDIRLSTSVDVEGDGFVNELSPWSTIAEWRAHPVGGEMLTKLMGGFGAGVADRAPELLQMVLQIPLIKLTSWGIGLTVENVEVMAATANGDRSE